MKPPDARRVALTIAVGRNARHAAIAENDARYACNLVRYLVGDLIRTASQTVAENHVEKAKKRILQIVSSTGASGILKQDITRKTQFIRKCYRDEYIADLVESGELVTKLNANGREVYILGQYTSSAAA